MSGLVMVVAFAVVVLLFVTVLPIAGRTQFSDQAEGAADAAALAAADRMRDVVRERFGTLGPGGRLDGLLPPSVGIAEAGTYADRNGADLVVGRYSVDRHDGRVEVEVARRNLDSSTGTRTRRASTAEVGVVLGRCGIEDRYVIVGYEPAPTPSPTPSPPPPLPDDEATPTPTPSPSPPPPPVPIWDSEYRFTCATVDGDDLRSPWTRSLAAARDTGLAWVNARFTVRLVR